MSRVLHISDLHFGRIHPPAVQSLERFLEDQGQSLDLIVMTGDWTQRARRAEYLEAERFIESLRVPILSVPGNHDIPLYDFFTRWLRPWVRYDRSIRPRTVDTFHGEGFVVAGVTSPSPRRSVEGRISSRDVTRAKEIFEEAPIGALRILAVHHPLYIPGQETKVEPRERVDALLALRPHLVLSGHSHLNWFENIEYDGGQKTVHLSAGSALSNRLRGEANSFHLIDVGRGEVVISTCLLGEQGFVIEPEPSHRVSF